MARPCGITKGWHYISIAPFAALQDHWAAERRRSGYGASTSAAVRSPTQYTATCIVSINVGSSRLIGDLFSCHLVCIVKNPVAESFDNIHREGRQVCSSSDRRAPSRTQCPSMQQSRPDKRCVAYQRARHPWASPTASMSRWPLYQQSARPAASLATGLYAPAPPLLASRRAPPPALRGCLLRHEGFERFKG